MFVRKKENRSGSISVVVADKSGGVFRELHTVGVATDKDEIEALVIKGRNWIDKKLGILRLDFNSEEMESEVPKSDIPTENQDSSPMEEDTATDEQPEQP